MNSPTQPFRVPRIHIVGRRNCGKTTLVCELIEALTGLGMCVGSVKHTHHHHELDTPGKDSYRHREAGAAAVGILSPQVTALFIPRQREQDVENREQRYAAFDRAFSNCDLILVEGDLHTTAPRIEVWRAVSGELPYAATDGGITAVVSDDACPPTAGRQIARSDLPGIVQHLRQMMHSEQQ